MARMLIPIQTEVVFRRWPIVNFLLLAVFALAFLGMMVTGTAPMILVLDGWNPVGLAGHVFLHGDLMHLLGNMVFLWVFGNALNEKMGQLPYLGFFFGAAVVAAVAHNLFDGDPAIGASGAINGVVGAYFVLYPTNTVTCFWLFFFRGGTTRIPGYVLIIAWFLLDLFMALSGGDGTVAYWSHVGGFLCGLVAGSAMVYLGNIEMGTYDNPNLLALLKITPRSKPDRTAETSGPPGSFAFDCPHCGSGIQADESQLGGSLNCWSCRQLIHLEEE